MKTNFNKPHDFSYNADLKTLADCIKQLIVAVNALEEKAAKPKRKAPVKKAK